MRNGIQRRALDGAWEFAPAIENETAQKIASMLAFVLHQADAVAVAHYAGKAE